MVKTFPTYIFGAIINVFIKLNEQRISLLVLCHGGNGSNLLNEKIMQLTAKLIQLLPLQSGTGRNGEWRKQDIIVETQDQYPKKVCISLWGNKF